MLYLIGKPSTYDLKLCNVVLCCSTKLFHKRHGPTDTLHGNGRSSPNIHATKIFDIPKDAQRQRASFDILYTYVSYILSELQRFP